MRYLILVLMLTASFSQELEVEGNLKVQGNIDASNQRVTNVGSPTDLQDAVNTEFLQNALRDDGPFEYKLVGTRLTNEMLYNNGSFTLSYKNYGESSWTSNFEDYLNTLEDSGWYIFKVLPYTFYESYNMSINYYIFRRPIED